MPEENRVEAVLLPDGTVLEKQPDGSYHPVRGGTDWARVDAMTDEDIARAVTDDPDAAPIDPSFWDEAEVAMPETKQGIFLRVDRDVLRWFKAQGRGYQTRINAVLRSYMDAKRRA